MADSPQEQVRAQLLKVLLAKIDEDPYPSVTMMNVAEELLSPDDLEGYAQILMNKVTADQFPSIPMIDRIRDLVG